MPPILNRPRDLDDLPAPAVVVAATIAAAEVLPGFRPLRDVLREGEGLIGYDGCATGSAEYDRPATGELFVLGQDGAALYGRLEHVKGSTTPRAVVDLLLRRDVTRVAVVCDKVPAGAAALGSREAILGMQDQAWLLRVQTVSGLEVTLPSTWPAVCRWVSG